MATLRAAEGLGFTLPCSFRWEKPHISTDAEGTKSALDLLKEMSCFSAGAALSEHRVGAGSARPRAAGDFWCP